MILNGAHRRKSSRINLGAWRKAGRFGQKSWKCFFKREVGGETGGLEGSLWWWLLSGWLEAICCSRAAFCIQMSCSLRFFFFFFFFLLKIFSTGRSLLLLLACNYSLLIFWFNFFRWPVFKQQISITAPSNGASWASNTFFVFEEIGVWFRRAEMKCNETGSLDDDSVSNKNFVNASSISSDRHSDGSPFSHALLPSVSKF